MLTELRVRNYALIEDVAVSLGPGLTVLTGETGAGKSIILGALSLLLGERADATMIRTGADDAVVEGRFDAAPEQNARLADLGIATDDGLILRRRVERSGRSTAYANDTVVTVASLAAIGDRLVDLHGQHQHQLLLKPEVHLDVLDDYAGLLPDRAALSVVFRDLEAARIERAELDRVLAEQQARRDLTEYQLRELADARIVPGEEDELNRERELVQSAERRFSLAHQLEALLNDQEGSIISRLSAAAKVLAELSELDPVVSARRDDLLSARAAADETWRDVVRYREGIEFSPERLDEINARLFLIEKLKRKHGLDAAGLTELESRLRTEVESVQQGDERRAKLTARLSGLETELVKRAEALSRRRGRARRRLEEALKDELRAVGLDRAGIAVSMARTADDHGVVEQDGQRFRVDASGVDAVELMFSANPGEELRPLRRVASGGELSRIMLGLKSVLDRADPVPTLVFDEIDVGIGGRVAEAVGGRLARLAQSRQVVCITHLPQIAKYADTHFLVTKTTRAGRTSTSIKRLDDDARVTELARMSAGAVVTDAAVKHAREMLAGSARNRRG